MLAPPSFRTSLSVIEGEVGQVRSRVELFERIKRDRRLEKLSTRELPDGHGVHRRTVRQALKSAVPPPRKAYPPRRRPAIDAYVTVIEEWLTADKDAPKEAMPYCPPGVNDTQAPSSRQVRLCNQGAGTLIATAPP
jgi:hypothetical protein